MLNNNHNKNIIIKLYSILLLVVILAYMIISYKYFDLQNLKNFGEFTMKAEYVKAQEIIIENSLQFCIFALLFLLYLYNLYKIFPIIANFGLTIIANKLFKTIWDFLLLTQTQIKNGEEYVNFHFAEFRQYLDESQIASKINEIFESLCVPEGVKPAMFDFLSKNQVDFIAWYSEGSRVAGPKVTQILTDELSRLICEQQSIITQTTNTGVPFGMILFGCIAVVVSGLFCFHPAIVDIFHFPLLGNTDPDCNFAEYPISSTIIWLVTNPTGRLAYGPLINTVGKIVCLLAKLF